MVVADVLFAGRERLRAYFCLARRLQAARPRWGCLAHALKALESFNPTAEERVLGALTAFVGATLPAPENVMLAGDPKIAGCGVGAALQASPVVHGGGTADPAGAHGEDTLHS